MEAALFQAILAEPDDLSSRLVYADWCEEQGDPRGTFIRLQLALARLPFRHPWRPEMESEEQLLLNAHRKHWNERAYRLLNATELRGQLHRRRGAVRGWQYRQGFIEMLTVEAPALLQHAEVLFSLGPLREIHILQASRRIKKLAAAAWLPLITRLNLRHNQLADDHLQTLLNSKQMQHIKALNLANNRLGDASLGPLLNSPHVANLEELVIGHNRFSAAAIDRLRSRFGRVLRSDSLWGKTLPDQPLNLGEDSPRTAEPPYFHEVDDVETDDCYEEYPYRPLQNLTDGLQYDDNLLYEDGREPSHPRRHVPAEYDDEDPYSEIFTDIFEHEYWDEDEQEEPEEKADD